LADGRPGGNLIPVRIEGSTVLVTGASSGIGRAAAIELARRGATLLLTGRDQHALEAVAQATGGRFLVADLEEPKESDRVAEWAEPVDILVNNAGLGWAGPLSAIELTRAERMVRVNLLAPVRLTGLLLPGMIARERGHVVNVASIAGHVGVGWEAVYSATKAGLIVLSDALRVELRGLGVRVSVVSPGPVDTPFFERAGHGYERRFPRMVKPERVAVEIARAIRFDRAQVFIPHWLAFPAWLHGALPSLYRRLARFQ
jgi:short-subunit dehydrogenase